MACKYIIFNEIMFFTMKVIYFINRLPNFYKNNSHLSYHLYFNNDNSK